MLEATTSSINSLESPHSSLYVLDQFAPWLLSSSVFIDMLSVVAAVALVSSQSTFTFDLQKNKKLDKSKSWWKLGCLNP